MAVHLRVCGENRDAIVSHVFGTGSPPRVRRKLVGDLLEVGHIRFTSACAEKMALNPPPRFVLAGSPPRVRRKF